jgi:peptidyl-prolyl cis-trans isomerase B (cyclophilin B)
MLSFIHPDYPSESGPRMRKIGKGNYLEETLASKKKQQNLFSSTSGKLAEYEQKQLQREKQVLRKKRDNKIALVAGLAVLALTVTSQLIWSSMQVSQVVEAEPTPSQSATPAPSQTNSALVPDPAIAEGRVWTGSMMVNTAKLSIELFGDKAPQATANFIDLARKDFFSGVTCHRLTTSGLFVLQCGDPTGTGTGGPGYSFGPIENAPAATAAGTAVYQTGVLAMANSGSPYSNGSQFFIVYADTSLLPDYTVFGRITSGLDGLKPIIDAGVQPGSGREGDGKPVVETKLGDIVLN